MHRFARLALRPVLPSPRPPALRLTRAFALAAAVTLAPAAGGCFDATSPAPDITAGAATHSLTDLPTHVPGDFDWDGDSDLLFQQDDTSFFAVWLTDSLEPYSSHIQLSDPYGPVSTNWRLASSADLSGDDRPDFVFENRDSSNLVAWFMSDLTRIGGAFISPAHDEDPTAHLVCAAYFNNDHQIDLVFQSSDPTRRTIIVWQMDPNNPSARASRHVVTSAIPGFSLSNFRVAGCGDFSGEGLGDLVLRGPAGNVTIAYVENYQAFEQNRIVTPTRDWTWTLGAIGDLSQNKSGHFQLVWQHDDLAIEAWVMQYSYYDHTVPVAPASSPMPPHPWRLVGAK